VHTEILQSHTSQIPKVGTPAKKVSQFPQNF